MWRSSSKRRAQHLPAAAQVHRQHLHAEIAGGGDGLCDSVRDIVQLKIEKNLRARREDAAEDFRAGRGVELEPDLEKRYVAPELVNQAQRLTRGWHVERNDDPFSRIHAVTLADFVNDPNVQVRAPAKINLSLRISRRRDDAFHEIETLIAPISLADELKIERSNVIEFECDDASLPRDANNLVVRAAQLFFARAGITGGARINLRKHIPHGAGLGGGSSDAASALLALNELFGQPLGSDELLAIAAEIGSDVPFFFARSAAVCRGRGEIVTRASAPPLRLLMVKPEFGVPTASAYAQWQSSREFAGVDYNAQQFSGAEFVNDLERPVFEKFPFLAVTKTWLRSQREVGAALLSGSGSTVFAALREGADAGALAERARAELDPKLWTCEAETLG